MGGVRLCVIPAQLHAVVQSGGAVIKPAQRYHVAALFCQILGYGQRRVVQAVWSKVPGSGKDHRQCDHHQPAHQGAEKQRLDSVDASAIERVPDTFLRERRGDIGAQ